MLELHVNDAAVVDVRHVNAVVVSTATAKLSCRLGRSVYRPVKPFQNRNQGARTGLGEVQGS